ncbi:cyclic nucleotide-binding domain-containing protein 2-like [Montipora capricornis]|uniref:cyclic nucleotide-binding domain-containing protein 2-like n=1 Tax=Montipora capricornis TaxID=246305 RepID=UPI0035F1A41B
MHLQVFQPAFKSAVNTCGALSKRAKEILMKNPWQRKPEDVRTIYNVVDKLKCFSRSTPRIKRALATIVYYQKFGNGRVIVQQGHPGRSMYFIVSGSVLVQLAKKDKTSGKIKKQIVGEMFAGDSFGELALLHGIKRARTIVSKGNVEFLTVDKRDFDMVLKKAYQQEWETKFSLLKSLPLFKDYSTKELKQLNNTSKLVEYPHNTVILRDTHNEGEFAFFIRSGQCQVVREMILIQRKLAAGKRRLILPPVIDHDTISPKFKVKSCDEVKRHFLVIARLGEGDCFGVGEDLTKMYIISLKKVEIALVPRNVIASHDKGRSLEELREQLNRQFPSRRQVFQSFMTGEKWQQYKFGVLDKLRTDKWLLNPTTIEDVPLDIRKQNNLQCEFFLKQCLLPPIQ